jgi:hypothetical protein
MLIDDGLLSRNFLANLREDNVSFLGVSALAKACDVPFQTTKALKILVSDIFSDISAARDGRSALGSNAELNLNREDAHKPRAAFDTCAKPHGIFDLL